MSLCFGVAFAKKQSGEITKENYIKALMAHFRGVRHPTDHPDCVDEMIFVWTRDAFGDAIRDIALKTEYEPLNDTSILEKLFCTCLTDDVETFTSMLEEILCLYPTLNLIPASAALAAYEQQPRIFKYCLSRGASLADHSVQSGIKTATSGSSVCGGPSQPKEWRIPFLDALYEVDWEGIRSSRKALGKWFSDGHSPEVKAWFFEHGAEVTTVPLQQKSGFPPGSWLAKIVAGDYCYW